MAAEKPKDLFLINGISCLCFNKDFTQCALSQKDSNIYIYKTPNLQDTNSWTLIHKLTEHLLYVSGIDWNHKTDKIVSCSHDKTSLIWTFEGDKWIPSYSVGTADASVLFCHWNTEGTKFVQGTGDKKLFIGYSSEKEDGTWWMLWNIKIHKSSVTCARFSPDSLKVISGSTDNKIIISSCYIDKIDDPLITDEQKRTAGKFGEVLYEINTGSWINDVAWSLDGRFSFASSQESKLYIRDLVNGSDTVINSEFSPITTFVPINNTSFYAVGYDRVIYLYSYQNDKWTMEKTVSSNAKKEQNQSGQSSAQPFSGSSFTQRPFAFKQGGGVSEVLKKFESSGMKKKTSLVVTTESKEGLHSTTISSVTLKNNELITTDFAGFVKYWKI